MAIFLKKLILVNHKRARTNWLGMVEKRFFLVFLLGILVILITSQGKTLASDEFSWQFDKKAALVGAVEKIKPGSLWRPEGYGSGEYLATIPTIRAGAVIDFDNGEVIWSMNLKEKIAPASLTKLATAMTAMDIAGLDKKINVSSEAADQIPTKLGLKAGEKLTLEESIEAAILTSANDACEAIADSLGWEIGDGTTTFVELVDKKLTKIGAVSSHFVTATGLDNSNHFSTVYDLAILAHEAKANYPLIDKVAALDYVRLPANEGHRLFDLPNWNALLGTYPGVNGLKIGYTENAGHVTITTASREGKNMMVIVIGAKSLEEREKAAATLLNYGFAKFGIEAFPVEKLDLVKRFEDWQKQLSAS